MKKEKQKLDILDFVFPFTVMYMCWICFRAYFLGENERNSVMDAIVLTIISFVFMYGLISIIRDLRLFGIRWMITSWRKIFKK